MHYHTDMTTHGTAFVDPIGSTGWSKLVTHRKQVTLCERTYHMDEIYIAKPLLEVCDVLLFSIFVTQMQLALHNHSNLKCNTVQLPKAQLMCIILHILKSPF